MIFDILTLFPDLVYNYTDESILGRAQQQGIITVRAHDFRRFTENKQRHVDDRPYGGGPGMILQVQPIYDCLKAIGAAADSSTKPTKRAKTKIIIMDPAGKTFDQRLAEKYSKLDRLVIISGRYEGFDARIYKLADERISVGNYVLAGGELSALTVVEATARLVPGVLGNEASLVDETFGRKIAGQDVSAVLDMTRGAIKEYPQYTRPENFHGLKVPKVLLSGDHKKIKEWQKKNTK